MSMKFGSWLTWAPLAAVPLLAAAWLNTDSLEQKLVDRAAEKLKTAGAEWAAVTLDGRDAVLTGEGPTSEAIAAAAKAVAGTKGIRVVHAAGLKVAEALAPPSVSPAITNLNRPEIKGTWPETLAKSLAVTLNGKPYTLGANNELTSDGSGNWTLKTPETLADGEYEVTAEITDKFGRAVKSETPGKIVIDTVAPAAPTFNAVIGAASPPQLSGTWAEGDAKELKVTIGGKTYALGSDPALASEKGVWTLKSPEALPEGSANVTVESADPAGNIAAITVPGGVIVDSKAPAAPTVNNYSGPTAPAAITGSWAEGDAQSLRVTAGGTAYNFRTYLGLTASNGKWTLTPAAPLPEGATAVTVETADRAGNVSKGSGTILVDRVPPAPPVVDRPKTATTPDKITGGWDEKTAAALKVIVDGTAYIYRTYTGLTSSNGRWTLKPAAPLPAGQHGVTVETADAAGNVSSASGTIIVDATPPAVPTINSLVSREPINQIAGTWAEGDAASLRVTVDGRQYLKDTYTGLTSSAGKWALQLPEPLAEGTHDVTVETADPAGNISTATGTVTVDQTPPASATLDVTMSAKPVDTIAGGWAGKDAQSLKVTVDDGSYILRTYNGLASTIDRWSLKLPAPLGEGEHTVTIETADAAGNTSSSSGKVIVDSQAPAAPSVDKQLVFAPAGTITGTWAEGDAQSLKVTVGGNTYVYRTFNGLTSQNGKWTLNLAAPLSKGSHDATVETADAVGNASTVTVPGAILVEAMPSAPTVEKLAGNDSRPRIVGSWDSENSTGLSVTIASRTYTKGIDAELAANGNGWTLVPAEPLKDGVYDVAAAAVTSRGDTVKDGTVAEVEVDTTGPEAPAVNKSAGSNSIPEITGTLGKDTKDFTVTLAGKTYTLGTDAELTTDGAAWSLKPASALKDGIYDAVAVALDAYGNASRDATVAEIEIDTAGPQAPTVNVTAGNNPQPAITGTAGGDAKAFSVTLDGKTYTLGQDQGLTMDSAGSWTLSPPPLPEGIHDVEAVAADALGNKTSDASVAEITVDLTGPDAPTVNKLSAKTATPEIAGTLGKGTAALNVTVDGRTYVLGTDQNLKSDGPTWSLTPSSPLPDGVHDVVAMAADIYGNTTQDETAGELDIDTRPPPMAAPAVTAANVSMARPRLSGTWPEGIAKSLKVTVDGVTYTLGTDDALTSDGAGNWTLAVPRPLKDGIYDVAVEAGNDTGSIADTTKDELIVEAAGPAAPTVQLYASDKSPAAISGTWAEGDAVNLSVTLNGKASLLGTDGKLQSDGKGNWTLSVDETLAPGSYDVVVSTADKAGRNAADQTRFEILIKQILAAQTPPEPPPPADCGAELSKLLIVDPLTFNSDRAAVRAEENGVIEKIAAVMGSCPQSKFEIAGHADRVGSNPFNQALSERRAVAVRRALIKQGVEGARLATEGYGEQKPIAGNDTPEGRSLNRRIEITMVK